MNTNNKIAISVDIEDWYHGPAVVGSDFAKYKNLDEFSKDHSFEFPKLLKYIDKLLSLFKEQQVRATFFIVGDLARRCPEMVKKIKEDKHEIGCHGLFHYAKYNPQKKELRYPIEDFKKMTLESKKILEDLSQQSVNGYRAPSAYICGAMIDTLEELGFLYDSSVSVNSIYCKAETPLTGVETSPYIPQKNSLAKASQPTDRKFIEFPWSYYNFMGFKIPTTGGPFLRFLGARAISAGLQQSLKRGHTGFYFHAIDISNEKLPSLGKNRPFYFLIKGDMVLKKIQYLIKKHKESLSTYQEIYDQSYA